MSDEGRENVRVSRPTSLAFLMQSAMNLRHSWAARVFENRKLFPNITTINENLKYDQSQTRVIECLR